MTRADRPNFLGLESLGNINFVAELSMFGFDCKFKGFPNGLAEVRLIYFKNSNDRLLGELQAGLSNEYHDAESVAVVYSNNEPRLAIVSGLEKVREGSLEKGKITRIYSHLIRVNPEDKNIFLKSLGKASFRQDNSIGYILNLGEQLGATRVKKRGVLTITADNQKLYIEPTQGSKILK